MCDCVREFMVMYCTKEVQAKTVDPTAMLYMIFTFHSLAMAISVLPPHSFVLTFKVDGEDG